MAGFNLNKHTKVNQRNHHLTPSSLTHYPHPTVDCNNLATRLKISNLHCLLFVYISLILINLFISCLTKARVDLPNSRKNYRKNLLVKEEPIQWLKNPSKLSVKCFLRSTYGPRITNLVSRYERNKEKTARFKNHLVFISNLHCLLFVYISSFSSTCSCLAWQRPGLTGRNVAKTIEKIGWWRKNRFSD